MLRQRFYMRKTFVIIAKAIKRVKSNTNDKGEENENNRKKKTISKSYHIDCN